MPTCLFLRGSIFLILDISSPRATRAVRYPNAAEPAAPAPIAAVWTEPHKSPGGTPNKFDKALKDYARKGPIGLQGIHGEAGQPVWFRNLKIKELE